MSDATAPDGVASQDDVPRSNDDDGDPPDPSAGGATAAPDDGAGGSSAAGAGGSSPVASDGSTGATGDGVGGVGVIAGQLASGVRFGKFASVGAVGAVFDHLVLVALRLGAGLPEMWAKAAGIEAAILVMFVANERWTFAEEGATGRGPVLRRLGRSHLVRSGGVAVQLVVYWVLTQQLAVTLVAFGTDWWFLAASPVAIGVGMLVNYVAESLFTWRVHR